jgi:hypothetical protein
MLMKYVVGPDRYVPGLGTVLQAGDTVEVPDHLVKQYSGLGLRPLESDVPARGSKTAKGKEEAD